MYMENLHEIFCQKIRGKAFDFNTTANPLEHEKEPEIEKKIPNFHYLTA